MKQFAVDPCRRRQCSCDISEGCPGNRFLQFVLSHFGNGNWQALNSKPAPSRGAHKIGGNLRYTVGLSPSFLDPMKIDYLERILTARVYDVAVETPLDAPGLSAAHE